MTEITEVWVASTLRPNYEVSNLGRVRHSKRKLVLKQSLSEGYKAVSPSGRSIRVHTLVAKEFCAGYEEGKCVNHIDSDKLNNISTNLEWVTPCENVHHYIDAGRANYLKPERVKKLDDMQVLAMLTLKKGMSETKIAETYAVAKNFIANIRAGNRWTHLTELVRSL